MSRHYDRDYSPDYHTGGGGRDSRDGPPSRGPRDSKDSFIRETMTLEPPPAGYRPRSQPPPDTRQMVPRGRSPDLAYEYPYDDEYDNDNRSRGALSRSRSRSHHGKHRDESPLSRARSAMEDNFTNSTTGIGASLVGALAGGYAARQVSDRVSDKNRKNHRGPRRRSDADKEERMRLASTLIGAAIGGLGANALTNRYQDSREREHGSGHRAAHAWEGRRSEENLSRRSSDYDRRHRRDDRRDSDDSDYDYVYDRPDNDRRRSHRRDSDEDYRRH